MNTQDKITQQEARAIRMDKPIVLVGLMGAGKSTVGKRLANALSLDFIDSDNEIAEAAGCSISEIFETYGESIFRDLEKRVLIRLLSNGPSVIATGGGAFMNAEIREEIKARTLSIWLRADLDTLVERVSRRDTRPLLKTGDKSEILDRLMKERYPVYQQADITIDSNAGPHDMVVSDILKILARQNANA